MKSSNQINNAVLHLSKISQQNASASEEMAAFAEKMSSQADDLLKLVSYFKVKS